MLRETLALGRERLDLLAQRVRLPLGAEGPLLQAWIRARPPRFAGEPLEPLKLFEGLAVLLLQQAEALLRRRRSLLGVTAGLALLPHPGLRHGDRPGARLRPYDLLGPDRLLGPDGLGRLRRPGRVLRRLRDDCEDAGDPEDRDAQKHQHREEEQRVRPPRPGRGRDGRVRAGELDGGGLADTRTELDRQHHRVGAVHVGRLRDALQGLADAVLLAGQLVTGPALLGGVQDRAVGRVERHLLEVARVDDDGLELAGELERSIRRDRSRQVGGRERESEGALGDRLRLLDDLRGRRVAGPNAHDQGPDDPEHEQARDDGEHRPRDPSISPERSDHLSRSPPSTRAVRTGLR